MSKKEVLSLYRRILRVARTWEALSGNLQDTVQERLYINTECKQLFRQNAKLTDPQEIETCLEEGKSRLELALHYKIPYPRPINLPPSAIAQPGKIHFKLQQKVRRQSKPVYLHSHKELE